MRAFRSRFAVVLPALVAAWAAAAADLPARRSERLAPPPVATGLVEEPTATGSLAPGFVADEAAAAVPPAAEPSDPPPIPDFLRRSGSRAGGPANELNTGDGRARERLPGGSVARMLSGRDLYHGNYCGPGDRGPGRAPTDALDSACRAHDACYTAAGHRSCGCDRALQRAALTAASDAALSRTLRARAASVAESVVLMNCSEP
jgi:hypothetical protein